MSMKSIILCLCIALTALSGCGRSKPESSKSTSADALAKDEAGQEAAKPTQPDAVNPQPAAPVAPVADNSVPLPPPPTTSEAVEKAGETFGPVPPGTEPPQMSEEQLNQIRQDLMKKREERSKAQEAQAAAAKSH